MRARSVSQSDEMKLIGNTGSDRVNHQRDIH
jgi:hypothetical protein